MKLQIKQDKRIRNSNFKKDLPDIKESIYEEHLEAQSNVVRKQQKKEEMRIRREYEKMNKMMEQSAMAEFDMKLNTVNFNEMACTPQEVIDRGKFYIKNDEIYDQTINEQVESSEGHIEESQQDEENGEMKGTEEAG